MSDDEDVIEKKRGRAEALPTKEWLAKFEGEPGELDVSEDKRLYAVKSPFVIDRLYRDEKITKRQHMAAARLKLFVVFMRQKSHGVARLDAEAERGASVEDAAINRITAEDLYLRTMRELREIRPLSEWIVQYLVRDDVTPNQIRAVLKANHTLPRLVRVGRKLVEREVAVVIGKNRIMEEVKEALADLEQAHKKRRQYFENHGINH